MRRPWIVVPLIVGALAGAILIMTAQDEQAPLELDEITTAEGLRTEIPSGWVVSEQFPFDFVPAESDGQAFDQWTVARACPADGCAERSLDEWLSIAPDLPMFTAIEDEGAEDLFGIEVDTRSDMRIVRAQTETAANLVFVAAFADGAPDFVACGARLAVTADARLLDAIIEVCQRTERVD